MDMKKTLEELIATILAGMKEHYSTETCRQYRDVYNRLLKLADSRDEQFYCDELGNVFIADSNYVFKPGVYSNHRYYFHKRCVLLIERLIAIGKTDWSKCQRNDSIPRNFENPLFEKIYNDYLQVLKDEGLKPGSICSYSRAAFYFLSYLSEKGYCSLEELSPGDTTEFFLEMSKTHWDLKCLGSYISGMKKLLNRFDSSRVYIRELPSHMPRKKEIIEVYTDEEQTQLRSYLDHADISKRNRAIGLIALETGMRAVDICNLKLSDIDWKKETVYLIQEKTGATLNLPLRASYGNAMMEYLLEERPMSDSKYLFLQERAPHGKITSHCCLYVILKNIVKNAGIDSNGRINGTRMMRHNAASNMVKKGVPLPAIAEVLGHRDPNSTMTYISTDGKELSKCTLPLPLPGGAHV
ncbi:tyrosine-type recombinase/integrase [Desulfosporosinus metallidurans]|uniref:Putative integrase/recombinase n=1 Tax=Desulfosporosinus metallidurans TaxID=1888891 RepID=A0A1Q8QMV2_9FIRM|nr:tyrosine-type recombinase/integrase [Desulfosporosinus metallidurans]OLN28665.1 putative integrase/recombinase [Desulfosporosinus metallidurans]